MGREMRRLGLGFDLILASTAIRVIETLNELAQGYGGAVATECDEGCISPRPIPCWPDPRPDGGPSGSSWSATIRSQPARAGSQPPRWAARSGRRRISDRRAHRDPFRGRGLAGARARRGNADAVREAARRGTGGRSDLLALRRRGGGGRRPWNSASRRRSPAARRRAPRPRSSGSDSALRRISSTPRRPPEPVSAIRRARRAQITSSS